MARARGLVLGIAFKRCGLALAFDHVLDLHNALLPLVGTLDDAQRGIAAVGILQLLAELFWVAMKHFGANASLSKFLYHFLVTSERVDIAIHHADDDRTLRGVGGNLAEVFERCHQA